MRILAGLVIAASLAATAASAADATYYAAPVDTGIFLYPHPIPECTEPGVLTNIATKFAFQDKNIVHSGLAIVAIDGVRQTHTKGPPSLVDMRYCTGRATLTNGHASEVVFIIEGPRKGKYSVGYAVESCLPGYDPFRVYDGNCRSIR